MPDKIMAGNINAMPVCIAWSLVLHNEVMKSPKDMPQMHCRVYTTVTRNQASIGSEPNRIPSRTSDMAICTIERWIHISVWRGLLALPEKWQLSCLPTTETRSSDEDGVHQPFAFGSNLRPFLWQFDQPSRPEPADVRPLLWLLASFQVHSSSSHHQWSWC